MESFNYIIGKTVEEAQKIIEKPYRVFATKIDGEELYHTTEYDPYRVHVTVEKNIITEITGIN